MAFLLRKGLQLTKKRTSSSDRCDESEETVLSVSQSHQNQSNFSSTLSMEMDTELTILPEIGSNKNCNNTSTLQSKSSHRSSQGAILPSTAKLDRISKSDNKKGAPLHTLPIEQGGLTISELRNEMLMDAKVQDEIIPIVCEILEETIAKNDKIKRAPALESFESDTTPSTPSAYVHRIMKYGGCSTCCLVIGLLYLERLKSRRRTLRLTSSNLQRLFLVSVMTAAKFFDDFYFSNKYWAQIGGITLEELNSLELDFLFLITFDLAVQTEEYKAFLRMLFFSGESIVEPRESSSRSVTPSRSSPLRGGRNSFDSQDEKKRVTSFSRTASGLSASALSSSNTAVPTQNDLSASITPEHSSPTGYCAALMSAGSWSQPHSAQKTLLPSGRLSPLRSLDEAR